MQGCGGGLAHSLHGQYNHIGQSCTEALLADGYVWTANKPLKMRAIAFWLEQAATFHHDHADCEQ